LHRPINIGTENGNFYILIPDLLILGSQVFDIHAPFTSGEVEFAVCLEVLV